MAFGTPGFLAPEQAQGQEVDGAADVFALGAVLVAAAGGSAFGAGTPMGLMYRSVHEPPDLTAVPEELRPVLASCLSKEPDQRPTPEGLLDLFVPDDGVKPAPDPGPVYSPTVVVPPPPPPPQPSYAPSHVPQPHVLQPHVSQPHVPASGTPGFGPPGVDGDPTFTAADPHYSMLADAEGVAFGSAAGDLQCAWAEIRHVEYAADGPRHLRVAIHLHNGVTHHILINARRRARLREWMEDLRLIVECFG